MNFINSSVIFAKQAGALLNITSNESPKNTNLLCTNENDINPIFTKNQLLVISEKYPNQVPIIVLKSGSSNLTSLDKKKFVVYRQVYISDFKLFIQKRINLKMNQAFYFFYNSCLINNNITIGEVFDKNNENGVLYINYCGEDAFG